jgi:hypothetical protein
MKCIAGSCEGTLVRYPMDLLMSPPIQQWQCHRCGSYYRKYHNESLTNKGLTLMDFKKDFDWIQMYMWTEDELSKLKNRTPKYKDEE